MSTQFLRMLIFGTLGLFAVIVVAYLIINKFLTEEFITNFMIDFSDILIIVVGLLNHSA